MIPVPKELDSGITTSFPVCKAHLIYNSYYIGRILDLGIGVSLINREGVLYLSQSEEKKKAASNSKAFLGMTNIA